MKFLEKFQRGGVIFNPKIYDADFGNFKQGFLSMKLVQNSNFRVQNMFSLTTVLRKIKTRHTLKKACLDFFQKFIRFGSGTLPLSRNHDLEIQTNQMFKFLIYSDDVPIMIIIRLYK